MSQLLARLDAEIQLETDQSRRAELLASKAGHVARVGRFDEARSLIAAVREQFGRGQSPRVSVRVMLAEGLIQAFERYAAEAADRVMRAQALAVAMKDAELTSLTSAWRAHLQSERSEFMGMARSLRTALSTAEPGYHEALARVAMTLANAYASCGEQQRANAWYTACRYHAIEIGDQATIEAHLYNRSSFAMAWLRAESCFDRQDRDLAVRVRRELASAKNLHQMARVEAGTPYMLLWEARALMRVGEFEAAIAEFARSRTAGPFADYNVHPKLIDLEVAYCLCQLGRVEEAAEMYSASAVHDFGSLHDDDQLVAMWLSAQLTAYSAAFGDRESASQRLELARAMFSNSTVELRHTLNEFDAVPLIGVPEALAKTVLTSTP